MRLSPDEILIRIFYHYMNHYLCYRKRVPVGIFINYSHFFIYLHVCCIWLGLRSPLKRSYKKYFQEEPKQSFLLKCPPMLDLKIINFFVGHGIYLTDV